MTWGLSVTSGKDPKAKATKSNLGKWGITNHRKENHKHGGKSTYRMVDTIYKSHTK